MGQNSPMPESRERTDEGRADAAGASTPTPAELDERVRVEGELKSGRGTRVYLTDAANVEAAATGVRRAVARGDWAELDALVAPAVAEYIRKYGLYRETDGTEFSDAGTEGNH